MRRRVFIALVDGAVVQWPLAGARSRTKKSLGREECQAIVESL